MVQGPVKLGAGTRVMERVTLHAPLTMGTGNVIYPNATVGIEPQDRKYDPAKGTGGVVIGNDNRIREGATVHRSTGATPTKMGDRNLLMANGHVAHDVVIGNDCTLANGVLIAGHVTIEDRAILGGNAAVHQFCRVGRMAMLSGVAGIVQDLPPFCVVYETRKLGSLNLVGLRRAGYREHIRPLSHAFEIFFKGRHAAAKALEIIERDCGGDPLCAEFVAFVRGSQRGITSYEAGVPDLENATAGG
jgi:UDP-N-acetylglucosamine acyltransferase